MEKAKETEVLRLPETGFLRISQVLQFIPLKPTRWWEGVKTGEFPKPVKFSARCTMWKAEDIRALIQRISEQGAVTENAVYYPPKESRQSSSGAGNLI